MALRADDVDVDRDRALVRRFQAGDDDAFGELYRRYHDRLERFCRKRVDDQHTAEEVAQEAFTRALAALPELGGELRFYPWVSVIAARLCVDVHRRQSRSESAPTPQDVQVAGGQEDIVDAVDSTLVMVALARLAPRHQNVLHLREVEGWSYQHIADHYGVRVGTVETLLFRARRALRREFHLVDGAGLVAVPMLGRIVQLAVRVRDRVPAWLPSAPSPAGFAAAATATAAAVVLAVGPGPSPVRVTTAPPAVQAPNRPEPLAARDLTGAAKRAPARLAAATQTVSSTPTTTSTAAPSDSATATGSITSVNRLAVTTTTLSPNVHPTGEAPPTTVGAKLSGPALPLPLPAPLAGASVGAVTATVTALPVPALSVPTVPPLITPPVELAGVSAPVVDAAGTVATQAVGLLPGL